MATLLVVGVTVFNNFQTGQGVGATQYADYAQDLDTSFTSIVATVNQLVNEVRGVQGPNQTLPLDFLQLNDTSGLGPEGDILVGTESYRTTFQSTTQVDVSPGIAILFNQRVASAAVTSLSPVLGTNDAGTFWAYIALDANGAVTINTAPGAQALDLWRIEVNAGGTLFVNNIQRRTGWYFGMDGDAWVEIGRWTSLGGATFSQLLFDEPKEPLLQIARLLSGFNTDPAARALGPIVVPGGSAATPGLIFGNGTGTQSVDTGFYRSAAQEIAGSTAGVLRLRLDPQGNLDLPTQMRVKSRRTATQTIADGGALASVSMTAADVFDIGTWHDPSGGSPQDHTVPTGGDGTYLITANVRWAEAITNEREIIGEIQLGGVLITGGRISRRLVVNEDHAMSWSVVADLVATNVIRVQVSQDDVVGALGLDVTDATLTIVKVA